MIKNKQEKYLSIIVFFWIIAALAFSGLIASLYLSISHYRVYTDIVYESFCALSKAINCDTVSQSPYSILANVPVPVWGILGYSFVIFLLSIAKKTLINEKRIWPILFIISAVFSLYSIVLALISTYIINSYCIVCIFSYGVNLLLLYYVWLVRKRFEPGRSLLIGLIDDIAFLLSNKGKAAAFLLPFFILSACGIAFFPDYWHMPPPKISDEVQTGTTPEGYPWIGAKEPEIEITEFADYQCFQCKKMHFFLRGLANQYPDKIRLIHRHFPMDSSINPTVNEPYHEVAGKLALMAEYAKINGKFWKMNDLLYQVARQKEIYLPEVGEKTELDYRWLAAVDQIPELRYALKHDIATGVKLGVSGTPAYIIDGKVYQGNIPQEIIREIID
jgi:protein-disulfide isomerase/uncharacterized membrane protein